MWICSEDFNLNTWLRIKRNQTHIQQTYIQTHTLNGIVHQKIYPPPRQTFLTETLQFDL